MKNTENSYGVVTIVMHWFFAVVVFSLFGLGLWMVELNYYSPWYKEGPDLHKSVGIILLTLMVFRVIWTLNQVSLKHLNTHTAIEQRLGKIVHVLLYVLLFVLMLSGYLISTADGRGIVVFDMLEVPSLGELFSDQEDISGVIHEYIAYVLIGTVFLHAVAALKHHFIDKDQTLNRMLGRKN